MKIVVDGRIRVWFMVGCWQRTPLNERRFMMRYLLCGPPEFIAFARAKGVIGSVNPMHSTRNQISFVARPGDTYTDVKNWALEISAGFDDFVNLFHSSPDGADVGFAIYREGRVLNLYARPLGLMSRPQILNYKIMSALVRNPSLSYEEAYKQEGGG